MKHSQTLSTSSRFIRVIPFSLARYSLRYMGRNRLPLSQNTGPFWRPFSRWRRSRLFLEFVRKLNPSRLGLSSLRPSGPADQTIQHFHLLGTGKQQAIAWLETSSIHHSKEGLFTTRILFSVGLHIDGVVANALTHDCDAFWCGFHDPASIGTLPKRITSASLAAAIMSFLYCSKYFYYSALILANSAASLSAAPGPTTPKPTLDRY